LLDSRRNVEAVEAQLHLARLHLGEVEHVVDQRQKVAPAAMDRFQIGPVQRAVGGVARRVGFVEKKLGKADDGIERRTQLVTHVGQEGAL